MDEATRAAIKIDVESFLHPPIKNLGMRGILVKRFRDEVRAVSRMHAQSNIRGHVLFHLPFDGLGGGT